MKADGTPDRRLRANRKTHGGNVSANCMRAEVLSRGAGAWKAGSRSAAELKEAATHYEQAAALRPAPMVKAEFSGCTDACRSRAEAM